MSEETTLPARPCVPTLAEQVEGLTAAVHRWMECYEAMRKDRDRLKKENVELRDRIEGMETDAWDRSERI